MNFMHVAKSLAAVFFEPPCFAAMNTGCFA